MIRRSAPRSQSLPLFSVLAMLLYRGGAKAFSSGVALSLLMLPTVILTAEEAIKMVPQRMREAAVGMGCTPTQMVLRVVLPTALPGILTGVMLAVARAAGVTAPLLLTALFSDYWLTRNPMEPIASLAVLIYDFSVSPFENQKQIAWAASLVLVFLSCWPTSSDKSIRRATAAGSARSTS
jgi:phosphate transport system permease protein